MKKILLRMSGLAALYMLGIWGRTQTEGFTLHNIYSSLSYNPQWEVSSHEDGIPAIFSKPAHYLGSGGQCYVFASADDQYVIKFFKHHRLQKKKKKLERDFTSYVLAKNCLVDETGLVYVHLNKTSALKQDICIIDKLGIRHTISLDKCEFIIQKKATLVIPYLEGLITQGKIEEAKEAIDKIAALIITRSKKGIYDDDAKVHRNFGFIEDTPLIIDVGRLCKDNHLTSPVYYREDIERATHKLSSWLQETSPPLFEHLHEKLLQL